MGDRTLVESVRDLNRNFGPTLVAYMADVRSRQMPKKWETGECVPRAAAAQRLLLVSRCSQNETRALVLN